MHWYCVDYARFVQDTPLPLPGTQILKMRADRTKGVALEYQVPR
jgi:hypothetical protein